MRIAAKFFVITCNFIKKEALAQVFSSEFCRIFKNSFSYITSSVAASAYRSNDCLKSPHNHRHDGPSEGPDIIFFLPHTYYEQQIICIMLVMMMQKKFQVVIGQLSDDYSDKFDEFARHFIHQNSFEISNNELRCLNF